MTTLQWVLLGLALNTADAAYTCHVLRQGGRELNPVLGQSCGRVITAKAAVFGVIPLLPRRGRRAVAIGATLGGGIGISVSLALRGRD